LYRRSETLPVVAAVKAVANYAKKNPAGTTPEPPPGGTTPTPTDPASIARAFAWTSLNIVLNPNAALYKKAKELGLGRPVTNEIYGVVVDGDRYVVQAFDGAILYVKEGGLGSHRTDHMVLND